MASAMSCSGVRAQWTSVTGFNAQPKAKKAAKKAEKKAAKAEKKAGDGGAAGPVSKAAKDAARKKAAAAMRDAVSRQGKAYDRMAKEMSRENYREYVLSVRHVAPEGEAPLALLSDWLPVCEVIVADKQAYEAQKFFRANGMEIPETEQQSAGAEQIEGVPALRAKLPALGADVVSMAHAMAGSKVKEVPLGQLEFGVEDWGSFENAVDGLEAQESTAKRMAAAAKVLGVDPSDEPGDIKRVYRKLIATEHPDRNPDASIEKFNAIKEAYELMSDRGGQSGATFEGLGDKAKRDFVRLDGVVAGAEVAPSELDSKVEVALRSLTIYDRIKTVFTARNVSLQSRAQVKAPKPAAAAETVVEETVEEKEPVMA